MLQRLIPLVVLIALDLTCFPQVSQTPSRTIRTGRMAVTALAVSPKGDHVLVGLADGAVYHDIGSGKKVHAFGYSEDGGTAVYYVAFNENGEFAVLIGHSGKRTVWNTVTGEQDKMINPHRWIPDPREVKAMGLEMSNSTFDRFYQQTEVRIGDVLVRSGKKGIVEFLDADGKVIRTLDFPENKDQHHRAPLLLWEGALLVGTDDGRVMFYDVL
jgi:WD40 repeat protein